MEKNDSTNISVIIPTYNSWVTLKNCINSIQKQTLKSLEIIVVDNGSTDGTSQRVKKFFPKVKLISLKRNTGVTGGRNMGIRKSSPSSDYLFFFDHDMVAERGMLYQLVKVAQRSSSIGIVTPKIYYFEDKKRIWSAGTLINLWTGKITFRGGKDLGQYEKTEEVQIAPAAMLVRKEVIRKVGGFDDRYFLTYEDTDFCFRAKEKGFKIFYVPTSLAFHKISPKPEDEADRLLSRAYWVGRNRVIFMKKFGRNFFIFLLFVPFFSLYYLNLALRNHRMRDWVKFLQGTTEGVLSRK